ncbi:hypothetical protein RJT34_31155 [Clitoria ternatea]|uniref:Uncharacterized protein n=1 Tax=Clitoria ternatea TaxID=43366 RepID=A0AAN9EUT4_CLITE
MPCCFSFTSSFVFVVSLWRTTLLVHQLTTTTPITRTCVSVHFCFVFFLFSEYDDDLHLVIPSSSSLLPSLAFSCLSLHLIFLFV